MSTPRNSHDSPAALSPSLLIDDRRILARYCIKAEFSHLVEGQSAEICEGVEHAIDKLNDADLWRMMEGVTFAYRLSNMMFLITDESLDWYEVELPIDALSVLAPDARIGQVLDLPEVQHSALAFAQYIEQYLRDHPDDDPLDLHQFRPRDTGISHPIVMVQETDNGFAIADGTHRLVQHIFDGKSSVRTYCAVRNGKPSKTHVGEALFVELLYLYAYRFTEPDERQSLLAATEMLAQVSTDGEATIRKHWIDRQQSAELRDAGEQLLARLSRDR